MADKFQWPEENYHGYVEINDKKEDQMFYWWFPSRSSRKNDPLVLWMTGGPGCSSELALFVENGPWKINKETLEAETNPYSWNSHANLVYIDQPIGTGFSRADPKDYVKTEKEVANQVYQFLEEFYKRYPEFQGRDFYIFGESYAGHYVPNVANYVFNQRNPDIKLKGAAIGNGLPNPWIQYEGYAEYSLHNKLIGFEQYLSMVPKFRQCETMMQYLIEGGREMCDGLVGLILSGDANTNLAGSNTAAQRFNTYDITKPCQGPLCYNFTFLDEFLNQRAVLDSLDVPKDEKWESCNGVVGDNMAQGDWRENAIPMLSDLLNNDIPVMMYHGDLDFICNWMGGEQAAKGIEWYGKQQFGTAAFENIGYGLKKSYNSLSFVKFSNAGHMVPMDQPESALKMMKEFIGA